MKKISAFSIVIALMCLLQASSASATNLYKFEKVFGRDNTDLVYAVRELAGGGYLLAGSTLTVIDVALMTTRQEMYVIKTDAAGNVVWSRIYGSVGQDEGAFSIEEGANGYYIFGNTVNSSTNASVASLLHIDTAGNIIWNKTYTMHANEWGGVIRKINENAFVICGKTYTAAEDYEVFLVKIDSSGNTIWSKGYNGDAAMTDVATAVTITADGGFLITGDSYFIPTHDYFVLAIKTDSTGTLQWTRAYADTHNSRGVGGYDIDNGYIIGGQLVGSGTAADMLLMRTDLSGNVIWSKTYGGATGDFAHAMLDLGNGYALFGESSSFFTTGITNAYVVKTYTAGALVSSVAYGDTNFHSSAVCAVATAHNGIAFAGVSMGYGLGLEDFYFVKTIGDTAGCLQNPVSTTVTPVSVTSFAFSNSETLTTTIVDVTAGIYTSITDTSANHSDSTICFSVTALPDTDISLGHILSPLAAGSTRVFPNPAGGNFTVQADLSFGAFSSVKVFNNLGVDVSRHFVATQAGGSINFTTAGLPPGNYWIRIANDAGRAISCRIVIAQEK